MKRTAVGIIALVVGILAVLGAAASARRNGSPASKGDLFTYASVRRTDAAPPTSFAADLPSVASDVEQLGKRGYPPSTYVRAKLAIGDPAMFSRLERAFEVSNDPAALADAYAEYMRFELVGAERGCQAIRAQLERTPAGAYRKLLWSLLAGCDRLEDADLFATAKDVPSEAFLEWFAGFHRRPEHLTRRAVIALADLVQRARPGEVRDLIVYSAKVASTSEDAAPLLLDLHRRTEEPAAKAALAVGFYPLDALDAAEAHRAACSLAEYKRDVRCGPGAKQWSKQVDAASPPPTDITTAQRLVALGLLDDIRDLKGAVGAPELLIAKGRGAAFDAETGRFPNEHDLLLFELSALAPKTFDGALFEEKPPPDEIGPYGLVAYLGGRRYLTVARSLGDWYDVGACVGLLNAIARDRGSEERFLVLATTDQVAWVVVGRENALRAAVEERLLIPAGADDARDIGRGAEERAFQQGQSETED